MNVPESQYVAVKCRSSVWIHAQALTVDLCVSTLQQVMEKSVAKSYYTPGLGRYPQVRNETKRAPRFHEANMNRVRMATHALNHQLIHVQSLRLEKAIK